ncbi:MAG TPA: LysM peptidoglycan-binding domain-containing protein [Acidimicrobiales bacterium]|nr:LysM peptidoglycan-binding domain-containing protein [Acidimicrobiales bacterium]
MSAHTQLHTPRRWSDAGRGLVALAGVAILVVGLPAALVSWVGWPLPSEVPSLSEIGDALRDTYIPDEFLVKALAVVCWLVWIELVASLLVEAVAYVRGRKAGAVPFAGGLQRGAARLIATVALLGSLLATKGVSGSGGLGLRALVPPPSQRSAVTMVADEPADEGVARAGAAAGARLAAAPTYEVQRRDTLWDIAERQLGDPFRWQEIFRLNQGRVQPDGRCLTDPDLIYAGWRLELPDDASGFAAPGQPGPPGPGASPARPTTPDAPAPAPDNARPTADGGMVLLDDGRGPAGPDAVADAADAAEKGGARGPRHDGGGMVLLPDDGPWGPSPVPPPTPQPPGEQIAAGEG